MFTNTNGILTSYDERYAVNQEGATAAQALWQSVIMQAVIDACSGSKKPSMRRIRAEARAWFCFENSDFTEVCTLAGMNPLRVMRGAHKAIKQAKEKEKHLICPLKRTDAKGAKKGKRAVLRKKAQTLRPKCAAATPFVIA